MVQAPALVVEDSPSCYRTVGTIATDGRSRCVLRSCMLWWSESDLLPGCWSV